MEYSGIREKEREGEKTGIRRNDRCHHLAHPPFFTSPPDYHIRTKKDSPFYSYFESSPYLNCRHPRAATGEPKMIRLSTRFQCSNACVSGNRAILSTSAPLLSCVLVERGREHDPRRVDISVLNIFDSYSFLAYRRILIVRLKIYNILMRLYCFVRLLKWQKF